MIIAENVDGFEVNEHRLVYSQENCLFDASMKTLLMRFENKVHRDSILLFYSSVFAADWYGNNQMILENQPAEFFPHTAYFIIDSDSVIVRLLEPSRNARVDTKGNIVWELEGGYFPRFEWEGICVLQERILRLLFVNSTTGEVLRIQDYSTPLGTHNGTLWLGNETNGTIEQIDIKTGERLDEIPKSVVESLRKYHISQQNLQLDVTGTKLVHPCGEIDIATKQLIPRPFFLDLKAKGRTFVTFFEFAHDASYIAFAYQDDTSNDDTKALFVIIERATERVLYNASVNPKTYTGIKRIRIRGNQVFYLDNLGFLNQIDLDTLG